MRRTPIPRPRRISPHVRLVLIVAILTVANLAFLAGIESKQNSEIASAGLRDSGDTQVTLPSEAPIEIQKPSVYTVSMGAYLSQRQGRVGVAIEFPETGERHTWNGDEAFSAHSTFKLALLGATLREAERQRRDVTLEEWSLLRPMIERSDNDAANLVFANVGAGGVEAYLRDLDLDGVHVSTDGRWGTSEANAGGLVRLMANLERCLGFSALSCAHAKSLLAEIEPDQYWGIPEAIPDSAVNGFKNGWFPDEEGGVWRVHSVASVSPPGQPDRRFVLAVMTEFPLSLGYTYGISTTESVASALWTAVLLGWRPGATGVGSLTRP